jgi:hypothetical protein
VAKISATAGAHGTVSPDGVSYVGKGGSITYIITADSGYAVDAVMVDSVNQGPKGKYTFSNITAGDHTISATFKSVQPVNLALNKTATASSVESSTQGTFPAANAVDADTKTRWSSASTDNEWLMVDLGAVYKVTKAVLMWEAAFATSYKIQTSAESSITPTTVWNDAATNTSGAGGTETLTLNATARFVRMLGVSRTTITVPGWTGKAGYSLFDFQVMGDPNSIGPSITTQPVSVKKLEGATASFSVVASSNSGMISYQWYRANPGSSTFSVIAGATSASYTTPVLVKATDNGAQYYVCVTDTTNSMQVESAKVLLTVTGPGPNITVQPADATVNQTQTATFSVVADSGSGTSLTYQWQRAEPGSSTYAPIFGATSASYTTPALSNATDNGAHYNVVLTETGTNIKVTSLPALLTVTASEWNWVSSGEMDSWTDPWNQDVNTNVWGARDGWKQTVYAKDHNTWKVVANLDAKQYIGSYPNATFYVNKPLGAVIDSGTTLTCEFESYSDRNSVYNNSFDIWCGATSGPDSLEIMVWTDRGGGLNPISDGRQWSASFGGVSYNVTKGAGGSGGPCVSFLANGMPIHKGTLNVSEVVKWVRDNAGMLGLPAKNLETLVEVQYGWEICNCYGGDKTYEMKKFECKYNGVIPTPTPPPVPTYPLKVNMGGMQDSGSWLKDTWYHGGKASLSQNAVDTSLLTGPVPPQDVLLRDRWGVFTYTYFNLTPGQTCKVNMYFAESYWTAAGKRIFDVVINGQKVLPNFDVVAAAGGVNKAVMKTFTVQADGAGKIIVDFQKGTADQPKVNAMEIIPQ